MEIDVLHDRARTAAFLLFDEGRHPRAPSGTAEGGRFVPVGGGGDWWQDRSRLSPSRRATTGEMRPATDAEKKKLGIPPAYTNVKVAVDPSKVEKIATAVTAKGDTVPYYSKAYQERRDVAKWARICAMHRELPGVAARIGKEIDQHGEHYDEAMSLRLIIQTGLRNGGDEGGGEVKAYGASNMLMQHVTVRGDTVHMKFPGKSGIEQDHTLVDGVLARYIEKRRADGATDVFPHDAKATLRYLKSITSDRFKVHDLRTWFGTIMADRMVQGIVKAGLQPSNKKEFKTLRKQIAQQVAAQLGNTYGITLNAYIHPAVFRSISPVKE